MDDRINPGTYTVTSLADTGAGGTFRWAINKVNGTTTAAC
jgi:hypothetical protein